MVLLSPLSVLLIRELPLVQLVRSGSAVPGSLPHRLQVKEGVVPGADTSQATEVNHALAF